MLNSALEPLQCAVCSKVVDSLMCYEDISNNKYVFIVNCHGETETTEIDVRDFVLGKISIGKAFSQKKLENQKLLTDNS